MTENIYIGIVEDHDIVRQGLVAMLKEQPGIKVLFDVSNGQELLDRLKSTKPDIILLDHAMPIMTGKEALEKLKRLYPNLKVIIISAFSEESFILDYVRKGVNSFLNKNCKINELITAITSVYHEGSYFDNKITMLLAKEIAAPSNHNEESLESHLSEQDKTIIKLICEHKSNKEVADQLSLSKKTIDYHRAKIMRLTRSKNVTELITFAIRAKLINIL